MATIAAAMDTAARAVSVTPPSSWVSATQLVHVQMRDDFLAQAVDELHERLDWPSPIGKVQTITGDGSTTFDLNADFLRLVREGEVYESANTRRFGVPFTSEAEYQHLTDLGTAGAYRYFRTAGYDGAFTIEFYPATASGDSINVAYVSNLWKADSGGTAGSEWMSDDDVLLFPRRLIELSVEWRFREDKGLPYAAKQAQYETELSRRANDAKMLRKIDASDTVSDYKPMRHPIPDFIPAS